MSSIDPAQQAPIRPPLVRKDAQRAFTKEKTEETSMESKTEQAA
jgi:hypothetical protein